MDGLSKYIVATTYHALRRAAFGVWTRVEAAIPSEEAASQSIVGGVNRVQETVRTLQSVSKKVLVELLPGPELTHEPID